MIGSKNLDFLGGVFKTEYFLLTFNRLEVEMKFLFKKFVLPIGLIMLLGSLTAIAAPKNDKLDKARSYVCYYGSVGNAELEALSKYDVVIIDPGFFRSQAKPIIAKLKRKGCIVIGYQSFMEVAEFHRYKDRVKEDWLLKVDGKLWVPWGKNHALDLNNPMCRKLLVELTKSEALNYGCDGVFMDTLADIDNATLPEDMRKKQLDGLDKLLKDLRATYPKCILISNWTLQSSLPVVAKYVDIVCWEDFAEKYFDKPNSFCHQVSKKLADFQKKYNFKVYALWSAEKDVAEQQRSAKFAESLGYLFSITGDYRTRFVFGEAKEKKEKK